MERRGARGMDPLLALSVEQWAGVEASRGGNRRVKNVMRSEMKGLE